MAKRRSRHKISTKNKSYTANQSPLFKLSSKKKLCELLFITPKELKQLSSSDSEYNVFLRISDGKKPREIQHPVNELEKVHTRIASLLCRIEMPGYVESGTMGKSHITNASKHIGKTPLLKTDITAFYPSTTRKMVKWFFRKHLQCSTDIATILSDISTYQGRIPTGSRLSMPLAFWANYRMFSDLDLISSQLGITMTLYVDDLTFSGNSVDREFQNRVLRVIKRHDHSAHKTKTRLYGPNEVKIVTGAALVNDSIKPRNESLRRIHQDMLLWEAAMDEDTYIHSLTPINRLLGRLSALSQIDQRYRDKARSLRKADKLRRNRPLAI